MPGEACPEAANVVQRLNERRLTIPVRVPEVGPSSNSLNEAVSEHVSTSTCYRKWPCAAVGRRGTNECQATRTWSSPDRDACPDGALENVQNNVLCSIDLPG
jgi:hypothetical protein